MLAMEAFDATCGPLCGRCGEGGEGGEDGEGGEGGAAAAAPSCGAAAVRTTHAAARRVVRSSGRQGMRGRASPPPPKRYASEHGRQRRLEQRPQRLQWQQEPLQSQASLPSELERACRFMARRQSAPPRMTKPAAPRAGAACDQGRRAANEDAVALVPGVFCVRSSQTSSVDGMTDGDSGSDGGDHAHDPPAFTLGNGQPEDEGEPGGVSTAAWLGETAYHMYAVFDGHGGKSISKHCSQNMHKFLAEEARNMPEVKAGGKMSAWAGDLFKRTFHKCDSTAAEAVGQSQAQGSGSTAVVALVGGGHVAVANCGDSRAVLSRGGRAVPLSFDHKPERPDEMQRVESLGGQVVFWNGYRVLGVLAMSRAIGDHCLRPFVIPDPEVRTVEVGADDDFLILASDGLWDALSNEDACNAAARALARWREESARCGQQRARGGQQRARKTGEQLAADVLVRLAIARGSADNVSAVVVDLKAHRPSTSASSCAH